MKTITLNEAEIWMLQIALENELLGYGWWYEEDERTEQNCVLLKAVLG